MVGEPAGSVDNDTERRLVRNWKQTEGITDDGELPVAVCAEHTPSDSKMLHSEVSPEVLNRSRGLSLISKSSTPSKLSISHSFGRNEDILVS